MNCQNCNSILEADAVFCGNCGAKQTAASSSSQNTAHENAAHAAIPNAKVEEVKSFFKENLLQIIKSIFMEPIKGTLEIFKNAGDGAYKQALILIITTAVVFTLVPFLMINQQVRDMLGGIGVFLKLGMSVGLVLIIISSLTFAIKAISVKPDFKKELLTGGLCGIPLMILLLVTAILTLFNGNGMQSLNPNSLMNQGIISGIISLYMLLMLFNIVQQSFKASGTNDALSWYLSPLVVCIGFYIGARIAMSLFVGNSTNPYLQ